LVVGLTDLPASAGFLGHPLLGLSKLVIGVPEEDQPEDWDGIFRRLQLGVGSQFVGCVPQPLLKVRVIRWHDFEIDLDC